MPTKRSYQQNCPIALGLDVLGERWTLLILRELIGGARRYGDLRGQLPGIATNLLADRLRELEQAGLVDREELPPPIARTVYTLSDEGWRKVPPVIQAIATFGLDMVEPTESALTPLNGFLAGILLAFDRTTGLNASYRIDIDDRRFEFAVQGDASRRGAGSTRGDDHRDGRGSDHGSAWVHRGRAQGRLAPGEVRRRPRRGRRDAHSVPAVGRSRPAGRLSASRRKMAPTRRENGALCVCSRKAVKPLVLSGPGGGRSVPQDQMDGVAHRRRRSV